MGIAGIAGALGSAAGGFEQAHQADLQRQFYGEMGARQTAADMFKQLAFDPAQPDEIRNAALQGGIEMINTPVGKFNLKKSTQGLADLIAKHNAAKIAAQNAPPPPPIQSQVPGTSLNAGVGAPQFSAPPPPPVGQMGPQPISASAPVMSGGSLSAGLPATITTAHGAPPPLPPDLLGGYSQLAAGAGQIAGAQAGGALTGQIEARRGIYSQLPGFSQLPPETQAILLGGGSLLPLTRSISPEGQSVSGAELLSNPETADAAKQQGVQPDQFYNSRKTLGSGWQFAATAGRGEAAIGPGKLGSAPEVAAAKTTATEQAKFPFDVKKIGIRFANSLALQDNAMKLAVQRNDLDTANNLFYKAQDDYIKRIGLERQMETSYQDYLKTGSQQAQVQMLMAHVGMTTPVGGRVTRAAVEEAEESANRIGLSVAKWFSQDADGNYTFNGPKGGVNLTNNQMKQMLDLAKQRVAIQHEQVGSYQDQLAGQGEFQAPGTRAVTAGTGSANRSKPKGGGPPKPSTGTPPPSGNSIVDDLIKKHG